LPKQSYLEHINRKKLTTSSFRSKLSTRSRKLRARTIGRLSRRRGRWAAGQLKQLISSIKLRRWWRNEGLRRGRWGGRGRQWRWFNRWV